MQLLLLVVSLLTTGISSAMLMPRDFAASNTSIVLRDTSYVQSASRSTQFLSLPTISSYSTFATGRPPTFTLSLFLPTPTETEAGVQSPYAVYAKAC
jgi:hypothetical protein